MKGQLFDMAKANNSFNEIRKRKYNDDSLQRLINIINKKITTTFIGSISKMEKYFGELWGQGLVDSERTNEQLYWKNIKEECRKEILDNGNSQIRAIQNELKQYTVNWNRYNLTNKKDKNV